MNSGHHPVMLDTVVHALAVTAAGGVFLDLTCGRGGHSAAILHAGGQRVRVFAVDRDPEAISALRERFRGEQRFQVFHGRFSQISDVARREGLTGIVDGVLLDLGVSSPQLDDAGRGFSFLRDGPLDMRMDPTVEPSLGQWLNQAPVAEIARVIRVYGEERWARKIAFAIDRQRSRSPIETTAQLAALIEETVPNREPRKHPATRTFQALRIHINRELQELEEVLPQLPAIVRPGGRIVVLSFHSLEDRIVKRFMAGLCQPPELPDGLPVRERDRPPVAFRKIRMDKKALPAEVASNPRARSAVLRVVEKIAPVRPGRSPISRFDRRALLLPMPLPCFFAGGV